MQLKFLTFFISLFILSLCSSPALAASITVSSSGSGIFALQGEGMSGVAGIELVLGYDSTVLGTPSVTQGGLISGALLTANTTIPGSIRIAIVKATPFAGNGQIATISFATNNGGTGFTSISAKLIDANGVNLPVQAALAAGMPPIQTTSGNQPAIATSTPNQTSAVTTSASPSGVTTVLGTISMPSDTRPYSGQKGVEPPVYTPPAEPSPVPEPITPRRQEVVAEKPVTPVKVAEPRKISYVSVLERFKTYGEERTPAAMMALFNKPVAPELRQEPPIAVSDGTATVKIYVELPKDAGTSPNFSLSGVEVVSVANEEKTGALVLEVRPRKNGIQASITILTDSVTLTVPLTVVPPSTGVSDSAAAFADFLKDTGARKPRFDLNGDGAHDALDDFIYTGLFLVKKRGVPGAR